MRVVIVRLSHLGDVVQTLPLVHALRLAVPDLELGWAIEPPFAELVAPLARVFPFERHGGFRAWPALARELREFGADLALDAQGNLKSAVVTRITRAPRRIGFAPEDWREPFHRLAVNEFAPPAPGPHLVERVWNLARHVASGLPTAPPLDPLLSAEELARGRALLGERAPRGGARLWILHPGHATDPRSWPAVSFRRLAERLVEEGQDVLILTGPAEAAVGTRLARELREREGLAHWVDQRGLRDLAAVLHAAAERGARLVVGDSGPAHLAASVGLPVRLLAGPTTPRATGPWPPQRRAGSGPPGTTEEPPGPHRVLGHPSLEWRPRELASLDPDAVANELLAEFRKR